MNVNNTGARVRLMLATGVIYICYQILKKY